MNKVVNLLVKLSIWGIIFYSAYFTYSFYQDWSFGKAVDSIHEVRVGVDRVYGELSKKNFNTYDVVSLASVKSTGSYGLGEPSIMVGVSSPSLLIKVKAIKGLLRVDLINIDVSEKYCYPFISAIMDEFPGKMYKFYDMSKSPYKNKANLLSGIDDVCLKAPIPNFSIVNKLH